ncbi:MAG: Ig domain-containing protein [Bacteroidales bacterium]|nr:Ig domain-containing protein [Bacteroidales bacterium]MBO4743385.1 Ig domain-containing protein [Bacteroidales bacterium]
MRKSFSALILALTACAVLCAVTACTPKENPDDKPKDDPKVEVSQVQLSPSSVSLEVGGTVNLIATVSPSNATDMTVTWSTSDASVATVSYGLVTAVGEGSAIITATAGSKSATCSVQVKAKTVAVTGISLNNSELSLYQEETFQLEATVTPSDATDKTVTWSSSNTGVATVTDGLVKAVGEGSATITAAAGGQSATCSVRVSIRSTQVKEIVFDPMSYSVNVGQTIQLQYTYSPSWATNTDFEWAATPEGIVSLGGDGTVTGLVPGRVQVWLTADNGVYGWAEVLVTISGGNEDYGYEDLN